MTRKVYEEEQIKLQGWPKPIVIRPLVIKQFRRIAQILDNITNPDEEHKEAIMVDILLEATAVAMETYEPKLSKTEELENYVDMATMEHILNVATGVKLNDPNQKMA
jgi:hypothetical protein